MPNALGVTRVWVTYKDIAGNMRRYKYWKARIQTDGRKVALGHFKTKREARQAYKAAKGSQQIGA